MRNIKRVIFKLNNRLVCGWCLTELPMGVSDFCDRNCEHEFNQRSSYTYLRDETFKRDKGVCKECQIDTVKLEEEFREILETQGFEAYIAYVEEVNFHIKSALWEADHIIPIALGGRIDLSNIQTLCYKCHRGKTGEQNNQRNEVDLLEEIVKICILDDIELLKSVGNDILLEDLHKVLSAVKELQEKEVRAKKLIEYDIEMWNKAWPLIQNNPDFHDENWPENLKKALKKL